MANVVSHSYLPGLVNEASPAKVSLFRRFLTALQASRETAAQREIARHQHLVDQINSLSRRKDEDKNADLPF
jgi:hypothetical protein